MYTICLYLTILNLQYHYVRGEQTKQMDQKKFTVQGD